MTNWPLTYRKIGGIHWFRLGRLRVSWCIAKQIHDPYKQTSRYRLSFRGQNELALVRLIREDYCEGQLVFAASLYALYSPKVRAMINKLPDDPNDKLPNINTYPMRWL